MPSIPMIEEQIVLQCKQVAQAEYSHSYDLIGIQPELNNLIQEEMA